MSGALDRHRYLALMLCAQCGLAARPDLAVIGQIQAQVVGIFVVNARVVVRAEGATTLSPGKAVAAPIPAATALLTAFGFFFACLAQALRTGRAC